MCRRRSANDTAQMTRALQDRLALATVKAQNGWENMSLDIIEPQIAEQQSRKRPTSSADTASVTSTTSSRIHSSRAISSSPLTAPTFSDDTYMSGGRENKRIRPLQLQGRPMSAPRPARRARMPSQPWKKSYNLPESSPIKQTKHARFNSANPSQHSFVSHASTISDDLPSPEASEDDDTDLPVHSFSINSTTRMASSPPRTPPPARQMRKAQSVSWSRTPKTGEEGADLLIYLATSPSAGNVAKTPVQPPSTPPCKSTPLPSSHMTPGMSGHGFLGFGPVTPGTNFNFADFVNVTPSPAQAAFSRTPVVGRTPGASARRKLNFDNTLMPPSPSMARHGKDSLGMELGGELVS